MHSLSFAFLSSFGWAVGNTFGNVAARRVGPYSNALWIIAMRAILSSFYVPFALANLHMYTIYLLCGNVVLGMMWILGVIATYESVNSESATLAGTIVSSFPIIVFVLSIFLCREHIGAAQIFGTAAILPGLILCSTNFSDVTRRHFVLSRGTIFALIGMSAFGVYFACIKIFVERVGWFWPGYITVLLFPVILFVAKLTRTQLYSPTHRAGAFPIIFSATCLLLGDFSYNFAITTGAVSQVAPIVGASPAFFVILSCIIFREKIRKRRILGILLTLVGVLMLTATNH